MFDNQPVLNLSAVNPECQRASLHSHFLVLYDQDNPSPCENRSSGDRRFWKLDHKYILSQHICVMSGEVFALGEVATDVEVNSDICKNTPPSQIGQLLQMTCKYSKS